MIKSIGKTLLSSIPTVLLVLVTTFFLIRIIPGGPFDLDRGLPPQVMENLNRRYGLDRPLVDQFAMWSSALVRGDFGESLQYPGERVMDLIAASAGPSFLVGGAALVLAVVAGLLGGLFCGASSGRIRDGGLFLLESMGASVPPFVLAVLVVAVFSRILGWLPAAQFDHKLSWVLPAAVLAFRPACQMISLLSGEVSSLLVSPETRAARSRGISESRLLYGHVLIRALPRVLGNVGPLAANLVTGSVVVETIFQIPGLGKFFVSSVINRDYPLLMAITWVYAMALVASGLVVDLIHAWIDPRTRSPS